MNAQRKRSVGARRRMTVFGVFDDQYLASQAVTELCKAGFDERQIAVAIPRDQACIDDLSVEQSAGRLACARTNARLDAIYGVGEASGGVTELETGRIGDSLFGSSLTLAEAPTGSALTGGDFRLAGVPEHEASYYRNEWEAGHTVVTVCSGGRSGEAMAILRRHGSYDMLSGIFSRTSV